MGAPAPAPMVVSADLAALLSMRANHPNLVRILGVHHNAGAAELMVEFVHGRPLSSLLAAAGRQRIPVAEALTIARDVARGLYFLHQLHDDQGRSFGFIHGGLTAGKIIVGFDGVSRVVGLERVAATSGVPPPDPRFAPPEQVANPELDDRRVDIFAVGAVLLKMICGLDLVDGGIPAQSTPDLPGCPGPLEQVIRRALARDPARRHGSAEELRAALEGFAVREGVPLEQHEVARLVRRLLPEVMNEPAGRVIPPRPDRSMWAHEASRWAAVDSKLEFGQGGLASVRAAPASPAAASAQAAASAEAAAAAGASLSAPGVSVIKRVAAPNPLVPAASVGATTLAVPALADEGPSLSADAAAVLDELGAEGPSRPAGGPGGQPRIPPTGYMPGLEPPPPGYRPDREPSPLHRSLPSSAPYPAAALLPDTRAALMGLPPPPPDRFRWLPTRSVAGTVALLLFLFAATVAIAYLASG